MNRIFSKNDRIIIIIFSILCIIGFILFTLIDICWNIGIVDHKNIYYPNIEGTPLLNPWVILWVCILVILFFLIKGFWKSYKIKSKISYILYLISILILICFLVLDFPWIMWSISPMMWIILDIIGIGFFASFLTIVLGEKP
ncbi:MAG TPA: hypothetical protein QF753_03060 [Victivallales bacterium]|nr:hypothetical protein [Victivallales bacterium]